jgi:hypothetical protein
MSTAADILASMNYQPASAATKQQKAAQAQIEKLGFKVQWYDGTDAKPAFFSGQTPDTVFLRADGNSTFAGIMGLAFHEITHWAQFSDSGLWAALRSTVDDATMIEAATNYWSQQAGIDPVVRRSIAEIIAQSQGKAGSTESVDQIEQRMAGTMAEVEGVAQLIQNGTEALFRGDAVPGWFNQMLIRAGVRGRSAMSALKLYRGLQEAAKNNKAYSPGKFGFTIEAAQRGLEVMRAAREAAMSQPQPAQPAPASTATPTPQPAPAPRRPPRGPAPPL